MFDLRIFDPNILDYSSTKVAVVICYVDNIINIIIEFNKT